MISLHVVGKLKTWIGSTEAELMNAQFVEVSGQNLECIQAGGFRKQCLHNNQVSNHFCSGGGGGVKSVCRGDRE